MKNFSILTLGFMLLVLCGLGLYLGPNSLRGDDISKGNTPKPNSTATTPNAPPAETADSLPQHQRAVEFLHDATNRLFGYTSLQAQVHEVISIGPKTLTATGSYAAGEFPRLRLEYQIQVGNTSGTLIEVCDSQVLRTLREIRRTPVGTPPDTSTPPASTPKSESPAPAEKPILKATRRDVRKILDSVRKQGTTPEAVLQAQLGLGGIPALLASFERTMLFDTYQAGTEGSRSPVIIEGFWKPEFKKGLSEQFAATGRDPNQFLPERIRIEFDAQSLVPTRILYLRRTAGPAANTPPAPLLSLEFRDIQVNSPIDPKIFDITLPPEVQELDQTESFIEQIEATKPKSP